MKEHVIKADLSDVRLTATLFETSFFVNPETAPMWSISKLKSFHWHSNYEIFLINRGSLSLVTEKETSEVEHSLLIIPPFVEHYTFPKEIEGYAMNFSVEPIPKNSALTVETVVERLSAGVTVLPLTADERFYAEHIAQCLLHESPLKNLEHLVPLLFSEVFHRIKPKNEAQVSEIGKHTKYIDDIDLYISHHYGENIGLSDLADVLHLCTRQITRIIRKEYGCSLSELVARRRLSTACMLLKHTELSVNAVAANVGYGDHETYFYSLFKKKYGMTPTQYRTQAQKAESND